MADSSLDKDVRKSLQSSSDKRDILNSTGKAIDMGENIKPKQVTDWPMDAFKPRIPTFQINDEDFSANLTVNNLSYHHVNGKASLNKQESKKSLKIPKNLIFQFRKYFKNSTLHGLRYIGESQFTLGARLFWFTAFALAVGFAAYFITNIYTKWKSSPVIISYNPFEADINSIPFPVVTICNMNRAKKNEAEKILKNGTVLERKLLDDTCDGNTTFNNAENITWSTVRNFLIQVGNSCSDLLRLCHWGGEKVDCNEFFSNELTDEGLCCSFNRLPPKNIYRNWKEINILNQSMSPNVFDWNPETGYTSEADDNDIPRRPLGAGPSIGLSVIVDAQLDNYYCSSTRSTGFKVMLSSPRESPKVADFGFLVGPGFENKVFIEPVVREATHSLRALPIEKRQCYFSNERPLEYYRSYTQRNCLLECESKHTLKLCGCVPYYLPKNKTIKYCSKKEKSCIEQAKIDMETITGAGTSCHCIPACFSVKFAYGKSMSYLYETIHDDLPNITAKYFKQNLAILDFFFYKNKFTAELKSELYGFSEILSNTGGLLGLFLGFSFLSLVEIIYFISLRVVCTMAKRTRKRNRVIKDISQGHQ